MLISLAGLLRRVPSQAPLGARNRAHPRLRVRGGNGPLQRGTQGGPSEGEGVGGSADQRGGPEGPLREGSAEEWAW
jgi:hypothetical protein